MKNVSGQCKEKDLNLEGKGNSKGDGGRSTMAI